MQQPNAPAAASYSLPPPRHPAHPGLLRRLPAVGVRGPRRRRAAALAAGRRPQLVLELQVARHALCRRLKVLAAQRRLDALHGVQAVEHQRDVAQRGLHPRLRRVQLAHLRLPGGWGGWMAACAGAGRGTH